jgi:hypothetical protein
MGQTLPFPERVHVEAPRQSRDRAQSPENMTHHFTASYNTCVKRKSLQAACLVTQNVYKFK